MTLRLVGVVCGLIAAVAVILVTLSAAHGLPECIRASGLAQDIGLLGSESRTMERPNEGRNATSVVSDGAVFAIFQCWPDGIDAPRPGTVELLGPSSQTMPVVIGVSESFESGAGSIVRATYVSRQLVEAAESVRLDPTSTVDKSELRKILGHHDCESRQIRHDSATTINVEKCEAWTTATLSQWHSELPTVDVWSSTGTPMPVSYGLDGRSLVVSMLCDTMCTMEIDGETFRIDNR